MHSLSRPLTALLGISLLGPGLAQADEMAMLRQQIALNQQQIQQLQTQFQQDHGSLEWEGYTVVNYRQYDFFANVQDTHADRRAEVDVERLILEAKYQFNPQMKLEAELEIEHGGTGSTVEYEADEFGEYEQEIEKGGEVVVEKVQLEIEKSAAINWRLGHLVVPFGMANSHKKPYQYFTTERSAAETALIPNTWHETGAEFYGHHGGLKYQFLLVNGLDSSGFGSNNWIAGGYQTRMERANADDLAMVMRLDQHLGNWLVGGALYRGESANNRHQQNLNASAMVNLWELHSRYENGAITLRAQILSGTVDNAELITEANKNSVNQGVRGISATPVASAARASFVEMGYNLFQLVRHQGNSRLDLFARLDAFDSMDKVEGSVQDNPIYARRITTIGLNYKPHKEVVFKAQVAQHRHDGSVANRAQEIALGLGVSF